MSKLVKSFAIAALIAGALAVTPGPALAQHHHHGGHGGWHGGGWRGGGWGAGPFWGWGGMYPYYAEPYYAEPTCGWVRVRVLRHGRWVRRLVRRCW
jgi:hypothetical protein